MSEDLNKRCRTCFVFFSFFLSITPRDPAQQLRRGRPSNVACLFRGCGRRSSFYNLPRDLAHSPKFHRRGVKNAKCVISNIARLSAYRVWKCSNICEYWNFIRSNNHPVFPKFTEVSSSHPWEPSGENVQPRKIARQKCAKQSITQSCVGRLPWN